MSKEQIAFLSEHFGYNNLASNADNMRVILSKTNDVFKVELAKNLAWIEPGINPYLPIEILKQTLQEIADEVSKVDLRTSFSEVLEDTMDLYEDSSEDDDEDIYEEFELCDDVESLAAFMEEWCDRGAVRAVLLNLRDEFDYDVEAKGSLEELVEEVSEIDDLDFDDLRSSIEQCVEFDS